MKIIEMGNTSLSGDEGERSSVHLDTLAAILFGDGLLFASSCESKVVSCCCGGNVTFSCFTVYFRKSLFFFFLSLSPSSQDVPSR